MKFTEGNITYFSRNGNYPATVMCSTADSVYARLREIMAVEPVDCGCMRVIVYLPNTHMDIRLWRHYYGNVSRYNWRIDGDDFLHPYRCAVGDLRRKL
jgi:hypothetical protein|nr:MAG TPA: hypothetical protein [Caudoviricetes sp.]